MLVYITPAIIINKDVVGIRLLAICRLRDDLFAICVKLFSLRHVWSRTYIRQWGNERIVLIQIPDAFIQAKTRTRRTASAENSHFAFRIDLNIFLCLKKRMIGNFIRIRYCIRRVEFLARERPSGDIDKITRFPLNTKLFRSGIRRSHITRQCHCAV